MAEVNGTSRRERLEHEIAVHQEAIALHLSAIERGKQAPNSPSVTDRIERARQRAEAARRLLKEAQRQLAELKD